MGNVLRARIQRSFLLKRKRLTIRQQTDWFVHLRGNENNRRRNRHTFSELPPWYNEAEYGWLRHEQKYSLEALSKVYSFEDCTLRRSC